MAKRAGSGTKAPAKPASARPADAATLIIVDASSGLPRVLMGQRRADLVFMPGKFVFPGGRVDKADRGVAPGQDLRPEELSRLLLDMKGSPSEARARALALAAVRETFEEAGLLIGSRCEAAAPRRDSGSPEDEAGHGKSWSGFHAQGFLPRLDALTFFARAITPPGRPRRFDTRFFCVDASAIAHKIDSYDEELSSLQWLSLEDTQGFDLPSITRVILEDLGERLANGGIEARNTPVPYYYFRSGSFYRDLLTD